MAIVAGSMSPGCARTATAGRAGANGARLRICGAESWRGALPDARHAEITEGRTGLGRWLGLIRTYGFAILRGVPVKRGEVGRVAELFGFIRETNYGRIFDVVAKPSPSHLAHTNRALGAHSDNPYRDPVPGLLLLHCMESSAEGGGSVFVDGFRAAEQLRAAAAEHFALLTKYDVPFRLSDHDCDLRGSGPLISVDQDEVVTAIRYNNRSAAAIEVPAEIMPAFYEAYRHFGRLLDDPEGEVSFRMAPGDLFIVDNRRVLHGRDAIAEVGKRHLQGCYADRDALDSLLRKILAN